MWGSRRRPKGVRTAPKGSAVLGLDVGSSGAKLVAFAEDWTVLFEGARRYPILRGDARRAELDVGALVGAIGELVAQCARKIDHRIDALCTAAIGEAIVPVDRAGVPLANALLTADARLEGSAALWCPDEAALHRLTGLPRRDVWSGNAMRHHLAASYGARVAGFRAVDDLVVAALGVLPRMALSQASRTMLLDRRTGGWNDRQMAAAGIAETLLTGPALPGETLGRTTGSRWGLAEGTFVVCGGHDQHLAAIGAGAGPDRPLWASGTVDAVTFVREPAGDTPMPGVDYRVAPRTAVRPVPNLNGGQALAWTMSLLGTDDHGLIETAPLPDDPIVLPTLGTTGAPDFDVEATATIAGLSYRHDRAAIARATVEGIVLETMTALIGVDAPIADARAVSVAGGGARSGQWCALKAAAFDRPVERRRHVDCGAVGAALLARRALDAQRGDCERANPLVEVVPPDPSLRDHLLARGERYAALRGHPPFPAASAARRAA